MNIKYLILSPIIFLSGLFFLANVNAGDLLLDSSSKESIHADPEVLHTSDPRAAVPDILLEQLSSMNSNKQKGEV